MMWRGWWVNLNLSLNASRGWMPTVFVQNGFRFFFYSNEGDPREPIHIHVIKGGAEAKFWVFPRPRLARSQGFAARDLRLISDMVASHSAEIEGAWREHFGG